MTDRSSSTSRPFVSGLIGVLAIWGVYLAIGATGVFTDVGLFNAWRSLIVLTCSAAFLMGWVWVLRRRQARIDFHAPDVGPKHTRSRASLISVVCTLVMFTLWIGAWIAWNTGNPANATFILGSLAVGMAGIGAICALVGLSDPRPLRGKLWGLATLLLLLVAAVAFIVQVRAYSVRHAPSPSVMRAG